MAFFLVGSVLEQHTPLSQSKNNFMQLHCKFSLLTTTLIALVAAAGCGGSSGSLVPATGKVSVDGSPASGAVVLFYPVGSAQMDVASGQAGSDGVYKLTSNLKEGIAPGTYQVTVTWPDPAVKAKPGSNKMMMSTDIETPPDLLNGRYAAKDKSGLKTEITSSTKQIPPFDLKTK